MATKTSVKSGYWSDTSVWDTGAVPGNGDDVVIAADHVVALDVNQSGFANGLTSLVINGTLCYDSYASSTNYILKMNGNITGGANGRLIVAGIVNWANYAMEWSLVAGKTNTWKVYDAVDSSIEVMEDREKYTLVESDLIESTPGSYGFDGNGYLNIHPFDSDDPNDHTIECIYEIPRPKVGDEYRVSILLNATATINVPTIEMYGWYPSREFTTLSANASSGQAEIVLTEDLGLQQGDIIIISSGTESGATIEAAKGVYAVQSYVAGTKTVTLTANLQTNRLAGDYVAWYSRPIKMSRTSGTTTIIQAAINNMVFIGVMPVTNYLLYYGGVQTDPLLYPSGCIIKHCTMPQNARMFTFYANDVLAEDCLCACHTWYAFYMCPNSTIRRLICINAHQGSSSINTKLYDVIVVNGHELPLPQYYDNLKAKNIPYISGRFGGVSTVINSELSSAEAPSSFGDKIQVTFKDTTFKANTNGWFPSVIAKCYNCLFEGANEVNIALFRKYADSHNKIESFHHNQIVDNYKAWCKGGTIETDEDKLLFNCGSAVYPVFRDFKYPAPANRAIKFPVTLKKDTSNILAKLEIIDPSDDPLIDTSTSALATETADNNTDEQEIGINYKSSSARELILRISCMAASGNVYVDISRIEQLMSVPKIID